ncbi:MAG: hypothetical protein HY363_02475 [Candidatus Aenigmarchaeota archaeon]|nr:hypothetical protein [Candidatus Aenigmarchaeota archaeon]
MANERALELLKRYSHLCEEYGLYSLQSSNFLLDNIEERFHYLAKLYRHIIFAAEEVDGLPHDKIADKGSYHEDLSDITKLVEDITKNRLCAEISRPRLLIC